MHGSTGRLQPRLARAQAVHHLRGLHLGDQRVLSPQPGAVQVAALRRPRAGHDAVKSLVRPLARQQQRLQLLHLQHAGRVGIGAAGTGQNAGETSVLTPWIPDQDLGDPVASCGLLQQRLQLLHLHHAGRVDAVAAVHRSTLLVEASSCISSIAEECFMQTLAGRQQSCSFCSA